MVVVAAVDVAASNDGATNKRCLRTRQPRQTVVAVGCDVDDAKMVVVVVGCDVADVPIDCDVFDAWMAAVATVGCGVADVPIGCDVGGASMTLAVECDVDDAQMVVGCDVDDVPIGREMVVVVATDYDVADAPVVVVVAVGCDVAGVPMGCDVFDAPMAVVVAMGCDVADAPRVVDVAVDMVAKNSDDENERRLRTLRRRQLAAGVIHARDCHKDICSRPFHHRPGARHTYSPRRSHSYCHLHRPLPQSRQGH
jgi:hypothetical protein